MPLANIRNPHHPPYWCRCRPSSVTAHVHVQTVSPTSAETIENSNTKTKTTIPTLTPPWSKSKCRMCEGARVPSSFIDETYNTVMIDYPQQQHSHELKEEAAAVAASSSSSTRPPPIEFVADFIQQLLRAPDRAETEDEYDDDYDADEDFVVSSWNEASDDYATLAAKAEQEADAILQATVEER